jgi:hypothetical protein
VGPENNLLQRLDPFFCTRNTVGLEVIFPLMRDDSEMCCIFTLILVHNICRYAISKVDIATGKVQVRRISIVRQDVSFEPKPISIVFRISPPRLGEIARFVHFVLITVNSVLFRLWQTHGFFWQVCIEANMLCRDVHVTLK